ncbi:MAG: nucleotidyltransferase [Chloroflexota bacterium]
MITRSKDLFASLEKNRVKYVVIGGVAAILHGVPRMTGDVDLLIEPSIENAERVLQVLADLGYDTASLVDPSGLVQVKYLIFENGIKIDIMLDIPGLDFETAWANKVEMFAGEQSFWVVSKADLIDAKRAAGRERDLNDVEALTNTNDSNPVPQ